MDELEQAKQTFVSEAQDLLRDMESGLMQIEAEPDDAENINAVFRAAHTIKGSAGLFGLAHIVSFTHVVETVLERIRSGKLPPSGDLIALLLECRDHIESLIELLTRGIETPDADTEQRAEALRTQLLGFLDGEGGAETAKAHAPASVLEHDVAESQVPDGQYLVRSRYWHISLRFGEGVLRNGMEPLSFIRYLKKLGEIVHISTLYDAMPPAASMDPESCYLGFEIVFDSAATKPDIERVFEFVEDDCQIRIIPPHSEVTRFRELIEALPEADLKVGEILLKSGALTEQELEAALHNQVVAENQADVPQLPVKRLGEILVEQGVVHAETVRSALDKQDKVQANKLKESKSIRIDADRLDDLINLMGELVIGSAAATLMARKHDLIDVLEAVSSISRLIEDIHDRSLRLRMVQIADTFNRFRRVVRDISREIGKDIDLIIDGGETELDKSVVEKIGDPLTHLVRNAIDHGIENAETRALLGKPANGQIRLNAYHESGSIIIEVSDDGGGIDADKVLAKALANGLVAPTQTLTEKEIFQLIFEPGLSTAEKVSNLSGRGVGMDVVKRNVIALRGTVEVTSELGAGTTVTIRLPLTLSIIDGFLVMVGDSSYVLPLDSVVECVEFTEESRHGHEGNYVAWHEHVLSFVDLRELFKEKGPKAARQTIVVVQGGGQKIGLVVDQFLGEFQTVIKPLNKLFEKLHCVSGSTILGSGEVALILDVLAMTRLVETRVEAE
ncbi:MAG: chemotaxis protein CheA [Methylococcaceae bacterium]|nr:MAG: chemotaxis protein CheA [Methylococcaceae bacterium]